MALVKYLDLVSLSIVCGWMLDVIALNLKLYYCCGEELGLGDKTVTIYRYQYLSMVLLHRVVLISAAPACDEEIVNKKMNINGI